MSLATTRTAIALERYRLAKGHWPKKLVQLVPDFLEMIPTDVYSGKPLSYRVVDRGVVVYSIGQDRKDNGGKLRQDDQSRSLEDGTDIGVRLWDPAHRRQPPLPSVPPPGRE
jgi:hypothetical protein